MGASSGKNCEIPGNQQKFWPRRFRVEAELGVECCKGQTAGAANREWG